MKSQERAGAAQRLPWALELARYLRYSWNRHSPHKARRRLSLLLQEEAALSVCCSLNCILAGAQARVMTPRLGQKRREQRGLLKQLALGTTKQRLVSETHPFSVSEGFPARSLPSLLRDDGAVN